MTTDFSWAERALCRSENIKSTGADWYADADRIACKIAISVCGDCPVVENCLAYALATNEAHGIWGGMTPAQRSMLASGYSREQALMVTRTYSRRKPKPQNGSSSSTGALR